MRTQIQTNIRFLASTRVHCSQPRPPASATHGLTGRTVSNYIVPPNMAAQKNLSPTSISLHTTTSEPFLHIQSKEQDLGTEKFVNFSRRTRRGLDDDHFEDHVTEYPKFLTELTKLFSAFECKQDRKFDSLKIKMDDILEQNNQIQQSIAFFSNKYDELLVRMSAAESENNELKKQIGTLHTKIDLLERNSRSAMIEINNLPISKPEDKNTLSEKLSKIGTTINYDIPTTHIKNIYRVKPKHQSSSTGTVIVEFDTATTKDNILKASRLYNKQNGKSKLSTASIQLPGPPTPIYITEFLTSQAKHLYFLGRKLQKEGKCDSCWPSHGKILIKKTASSVPYCVNSEKDIQNLMSTAK